MSSIAAAQRTLGRVLPPWWLLLITGIGWMLVALIVLRFDYTSVSAISIPFGIVAIAAGVLEIGVLILARGWWKLLHAVLAVVFIATGIVAFVHPGDTFLALAAVFSFFLIFAGTFDIIVSISTRHEIEPGGCSWSAASSSSCSGFGRRATTVAARSSSSLGWPPSPSFGAFVTSCSPSACAKSSMRLRADGCYLEVSSRPRFVAPAEHGSRTDSAWRL
jgi:uncharacterized membrane protein HdeD (DUF308 family)